MNCCAGCLLIFKVFVVNRIAKKSECSFKVNGFVIEQRENIKYLGVVLDDKLNFKAHLKYFKSKLLQSCFMMSKFACTDSNKLLVCENWCSET